MPVTKIKLSNISIYLTKTINTKQANDLLENYISFSITSTEFVNNLSVKRFRVQIPNLDRRKCWAKSYFKTLCSSIGTFVNTQNHFIMECKWLKKSMSGKSLFLTHVFDFRAGAKSVWQFRMLKRSRPRKEDFFLYFVLNNHKISPNY